MTPAASVPKPVRKGGGAHLVGSVPLPDTESVFRVVVNALGAHLRRIPDGETGERRRWIFFQSDAQESSRHG